MKVSRIVVLLTLALLTLPALSKRAAAENNAEESPLPVGLFDAINQGLVDVKLSPKGALECGITVKNLSGRPLELEMPKAFAGVPILAQGGWGAGPGAGRGAAFGDDGGGAGRRGRNGGLGGGANSRNGSSGGNQSIGGGMSGGRGGMGGGGMGGGRGGMGGGWFVPAEKTVREKLRTVCLEHGKKDPRAGSTYQIVPIESYTDNKTTRVLCEMLGEEEMDQQAVQAAVWNQESGVSYEELSAKIYQESNNNLPRPWFSKVQLAMSQEVLKAAQDRAETIEREEAAADQAEKRAEEKALEEGTTTDAAKPVDETVEKLTKELTE